MKQARILAFTGHRHLTCEEEAGLQRKLPLLLEEQLPLGVGVFRSGGAMGFDLLAAQAVLNLREKHPTLILEMILPYPGQADAWSAEQKSLYQGVLRKADRIRYLAGDYYDGILQLRNRALIAGADVCVAYLRHSHGGGAAYTSQLALREGLDYINLFDLL